MSLEVLAGGLRQWIHEKLHENHLHERLHENLDHENLNFMKRSIMKTSQFHENKGHEKHFMKLMLWSPDFLLVPGLCCSGP